MSSAVPRLKCLACDRLLGEGELFCLSCGGVPFARAPGGQHAVVVGPVASMAFRRQAADLLADRIPGADAEQLHRALAGRTLVADEVDATVGRALIARLKKIPAEAQLVPAGETGKPLPARLVGPIPLLLYGAGLLAAVLVTPWALIAGVGAGVTLAVLRNTAGVAATQPPLLPPPPPAVKLLPALLPRLDADQREQLVDIARGSFGLLRAAQDQGLPVAAAEVEGMGRAVSDVVDEAIQAGEAAVDGDAEAGQRLGEIARQVMAAAEKLGPRALPPKPEQRLLEEADIVKEMSEI